MRARVTLELNFNTSVSIGNRKEKIAKEVEPLLLDANVWENKSPWSDKFTLQCGNVYAVLNKGNTADGINWEIHCYQNRCRIPNYIQVKTTKDPQSAIEELSEYIAEQVIADMIKSGVKKPLQDAIIDLTVSQIEVINFETLPPQP